MSGSSGSGMTPARIVLWTARSFAALWIVFFAAHVIGGWGEGGPRDGREFVVWMFFPIGFTAGYLLGWRWPLAGGCVSLACLVLHLVLLAALHGKVAPSIGLYAPFAVLGVPGVLFVIAGWLLRRRKDSASSQSSA